MIRTIRISPYGGYYNKIKGVTVYEQQAKKKPKEVIVDEVLSGDDIELINSDSFTVVSTKTLSAEKQVKFDEILETLKSKGYKFNYNNDGRDELGLSVFKKFELFTEIFLPFKVFNQEGLVSPMDGEEIQPALAEPTIKAHKIAANYKYKNPKDESGQIRYNELKETIKKFSARDVHLLLGSKCAMKIKFLIVNTDDEAESAGEVNYETTGTASFPVRLASLLEIPVFNLNKANRLEELSEYIKAL